MVGAERQKKYKRTRRRVELLQREEEAGEGTGAVSEPREPGRGVSPDCSGRAWPPHGCQGRRRLPAPGGRLGAGGMPGAAGAAGWRQRSHVRCRQGRR